jgi:hypothetical protein
MAASDMNEVCEGETAGRKPKQWLAARHTALRD